MAKFPMNSAPPKPQGDLGAPSDLGGGPPKRASAPPPAPPPPAEDPDMDHDMDTGGPIITPEAVSYRTADQQCNSCAYMGEDGNCAVLKMPVPEDAGCDAHSSGSAAGQPEEAEDMAPAPTGGTYG